MAAREYPLLDPVGTAAKIFDIAALNATPQSNIYGGPSIVFGVDIDAEQNTGEDVFVKFYDLLAPTVGTDDAEMVLKCPSGAKQSYVFPRGIPMATGLSVACVTEKGGGAGTTNPTGTVSVVIHAADG
jgi:hypothetical protein